MLGSGGLGVTQKYALSSVLYGGACEIWMVLVLGDDQYINYVHTYFMD
jgi:hypothetical protein